MLNMYFLPLLRFSLKKDLALVELLGALERTCSLLHARVIRHVCNRFS